MLEKSIGAGPGFEPPFKFWELDLLLDWITVLLIYDHHIIKTNTANTKYIES